jgi:hypothetical protein
MYTWRRTRWVSLYINDEQMRCSLVLLVNTTSQKWLSNFSHLPTRNGGQKHVTPIDFTVLERQQHQRKYNILFMSIKISG